MSEAKDFRLHNFVNNFKKENKRKEQLGVNS